MNWAIDGLLILIVAFCAWRGFKNGFIRGIFGILAIIIAIYGANLAASAYSSEFTGMLEPFVSGVVDKAVTKVISPGDSAQDNANTAAPAPSNAGKTSVYDVSYAALRDIGVSDGAAKLIAEKVGGQMNAVGQSMSVYLTQKLCAALAYIAVFIIAFILISIIFAVIGNIFNLAFSIPGLEAVDNIVGLVLGILKGLLIVFVLAVVARYIGLISADIVEKTTLLKFLLNINPLAGILGI